LYSQLKKVTMVTLAILFQFGLTGLSLYFANLAEKKGKNPSLLYFSAGLCFMGVLFMILTFFI